MTQEYQCSVCTRNNFNGDKSCPLPPIGEVDDYDVIKGMNLVIKKCGCGSFNDFRPRSSVQSPISNDEQCRICSQELKDWIETYLAGKDSAYMEMVLTPVLEYLALRYGIQYD